LIAKANHVDDEIFDLNSEEGIEKATVHLELRGRYLDEAVKMEREQRGEVVFDDSDVEDYSMLIFLSNIRGFIMLVVPKDPFLNHAIHKGTKDEGFLRNNPKSFIFERGFTILWNDHT